MDVSGEANFDSIVGPTHHYSGLAFGNIKSMESLGDASNPRKAALEGLKKMSDLAKLGLLQGVMPPQERPDIGRLRQFGFNGSDRDILAKAAKQDPGLFVAHCSASSMWAANAATVSSSYDSGDGLVHFTPANLVQKYHRSLEAPSSRLFLSRIFGDSGRFRHHRPVPAHPMLGDEGAANHIRLCPRHDSTGSHLFVYGFVSFGSGKESPKRFPARQSLTACQTICRQHSLPDSITRFVQLNPKAIDAGVFHADVIATGNENVVLLHQDAVLEQEATLRWLRRRIGDSFLVIEIQRRDLSLAAAVESYLFNSQIVTLPSGEMTLIVPNRCVEIPEALHVVSAIVEGENPINSFHAVDLDQSMRNGGGPACLRLRVVLSQSDVKRVLPSCWLTEGLEQSLKDWIERHYRDHLRLAELADPDLYEEARAALDELTSILDLGSIYSFQRNAVEIPEVAQHQV